MLDYTKHPDIARAIGLFRYGENKQLYNTVNELGRQILGINN